MLFTFSSEYNIKDIPMGFGCSDHEHSRQGKKRTRDPV